MTKPKRRPVNTTLDAELYEEIQLIAVKEKCNANDLIEEGMRWVIETRKKKDKKQPDE